MKLKQDLILASGSPRRRQLLSELGFEFRVQSEDVDESFDSSMEPKETVMYLAKKKNDFYRSLNKDEIIITADTIVLKKDQILNKPSDREEAKTMIKSLADSSHHVMTGVCISDSSKNIQFVSTTEVHFSKISDEEIIQYIDKCAPFDKAGAYGIQEWLGMSFIEYINGSYFNVVGLPTDLVYKTLKTEFSVS